MGLRFRKSFKVAPGVRVNVGKKSVGMSVGGNLGGLSFSSKTGARARVSAPGTGLSYSTKIGGSSGKSPDKSSAEPTPEKSKAKKPGCLLWAVIVTLLLGLIGSCGGNSESTEPTPTEAPIVTEAPTATPRPTDTPDPNATAEPTNTPKPTSAPTAKPAMYHGIYGTRTVYISSSGKIHLKSDCSGMKSYKEMTMEKAVNSGYSTCGRCFD